MSNGIPAVVPSEVNPDALAVLEGLIVDGVSIRAAVAFVTDEGVRMLRELVDRRTGVSLEIVARAADVTTPTALETLWQDMGADVSVVLGKHASAFHPKLWLIEGDRWLTVLSGSGNLTSSGLRGNDEQFELFSMPAGGPEAAVQAERFDRLTANALPLESVHGGATWREWLHLIREERRRRSSELERLARSLANRDPQPDRTADKEALTSDLEDLYRRTREAKLQKESGGTYNPSRFGQAIARARAGQGDPVRIVTSICRRRSSGFDILFENGRRDLTVEVLVLDPSKPYHDLFGDETRALCVERLRAFDDAEVGARDLVTQTVTAGDIEAGLIRIPQRVARAVFPESVGTVDVVLRGRAMSCSWNPMRGADRDRSGRIGIGSEAARALLRVGEMLTITAENETILLS